MNDVHIPKWRYGFIYKAVNFLLHFLNNLNLVELFKFVAKKLNKSTTDKEKVKAYARIGIDIFISLKWIFLLLLWKCSWHSPILSVIIWYLIITNLYSYFYNHIWTDEALDTSKFTNDRIRSRFLNLLLAVFYSTFCFAYLYQVVYPSEFTWGDSGANTLYAIQFSFSNSVAANYGQVSPTTDSGNIVATIQLVITFIFVAIILSRSIPQK